MTEAPPADVVDVRPRKARWIAVAAATVLVTVFCVVAALLRSTDTGVYFRTSDQVAMVVLGLLLGGLALLYARPRLRADADGVYVRNMIGTHRLPWELVLRVSFPDGGAWARLELPDDEYLAVMAIQATDKQHAVRAIHELRELHRRYAPVVAPDPVHPAARPPAPEAP
ncbi:MAG TPA: PH domain-containing protein [Pseudonocardiaceae bacterium]